MSSSIAFQMPSLNCTCAADNTIKISTALPANVGTADINVAMDIKKGDINTLSGGASLFQFAFDEDLGGSKVGAHKIDFLCTPACWVRSKYQFQDGSITAGDATIAKIGATADVAPATMGDDMFQYIMNSAEIYDPGALTDACMLTFSQAFGESGAGTTGAAADVAEADATAVQKASMAWKTSEAIRKILGADDTGKNVQLEGDELNDADKGVSKHAAVAVFASILGNAAAATTDASPAAGGTAELTLELLREEAKDNTLAAEKLAKRALDMLEGASNPDGYKNMLFVVGDTLKFKVTWTWQDGGGTAGDETDYSASRSYAVTLKVVAD